VTAISNYTARVADRTLPKAQRSEALKFLSHFVGDVHQPLHVGFARDRGGNDIKGAWMGHETNLHKVWDFHVVDRRLRHGFPQTGISGFARHLAAQHTKDRTSAEHTRCDSQSASACPNAWAVEAAVLASRVGYKDKHGEVIRDGFRFAHEEYEFLLPIIEKQITKGGVRLARLLDQLLGSCNEGSAQQNKGQYEDAVGFEATSEETSATEDSADTATEEGLFVEQDPPAKPGAPFRAFQGLGL